MAKHKSGELRCPATALIMFIHVGDSIFFKRWQNFGISPELSIDEPSGKKTDNEVFEQVQHKPSCTVTEA